MRLSVTILLSFVKGSCKDAEVKSILRKTSGRNQTGKEPYNMKTILQTIDLVKYYGDGESQVRAIDHTDIEVKNGEFAAVVGRSGSG